ncbi:MAG: hypothetical protein KJ897_20170, partial [Alphaproteobacteria bacterium]|nr:hypothetical protein [Alphaproteobacteria bacterium]
CFGPDLRTPYGPAACEKAASKAGHMSAPDNAQISTKDSSCQTGVYTWCTDKISTLCAYAAMIENSMIGPACGTNTTPPAAITSVK